MATATTILLPTADYIKRRMEALEETQRNFHETCKHLKKFWDGMMWADEEQMARSLTQIFRDMRHGSDLDRDPDVKVTLPLVEAVVTNYMAYLADTPQINMLTPPVGWGDMRGEDSRRALADQNQQYLYGVWEDNSVDLIYKWQAWYLALMGCCFLGAHPTPAGSIQYVLRSPEFSFPVWDINYKRMHAIGFRWEVSEDVLRDTYPEVDFSGYLDLDVKSYSRNAPKRRYVEVVEWYDTNSKTLMVAGEIVLQVAHGLGYCPWTMPTFYMVPDSDFGKGPIEGNVPLFQKLNMLDGLELQAIIENIFARLVLIAPQLAPEEIDNAAGAVIPIQAGGDAKWLTPPSTTTDLGDNMNRSLDVLERGTHMPGSAYGEGVASSITTGKAQHESMMSTGAMVEYVQGNIGYAWNRLNEMTLGMTESLFPNVPIEMFGKAQLQSGMAGKLRGKEEFYLKLDGGKKLRGWYRHELVFQPTMNIHEKLVMGLQGLGAGIYSKRFIRTLVGVTDSDAMKDEILSEMVEEGQVQMWLQAVAAGQMDPAQVEDAFLAMDKGQTSPALSPNFQPGQPGVGAPGQPPMAPPGLAPAPTGGGAPPLTADTQGSMPSGSAPPVSGPSKGDTSGQFTLDQAVEDFSAIKKIKGNVYLVGEIVQDGSTDGPIEVDVTDPIDKQTLLNGLPTPYKGQISFHNVQSVPSEPVVDVTPGSKNLGQVQGGPAVDTPDQVTAATGGITPLAPFPAGANQQPNLGSNLPAGGFQGSIRS